MTAVETLIARVRFVGRVADALTRADLVPARYSATLRTHHRRAVQKHDGHFVFADVEPLPAGAPGHVIELTSREFQRRRFTLPSTGSAVTEIATDGEDELQVIVTAVTGNRAEFAPVPFVPVIAAGASVIGQGGFATTLAESLDGVDVDGAELVAAGGLAAGQALRIVRGRRLLLHPGPYYPFPPGTTIAALRVIEAPPAADPLADVPVADAVIAITAVDGAAVSSVLVGGVTLFRATLPTVPVTPFMIGTVEERRTVSNARGEAIFRFASNVPASALTVSVTKPGYVTATATLTVTAGQRTSRVVSLTRA